MPRARAVNFSYQRVFKPTKQLLKRLKFLLEPSAVLNLDSVKPRSVNVPQYRYNRRRFSQTSNVIPDNSRKRPGLALESPEHTH